MFASDGIDRGKKIGIIISNNLQVEKGCHAMTNATLRGKPDAGNPHVRFDEGEVASAKPRRGSLLYNAAAGSRAPRDRGGFGETALPAARWGYRALPLVAAVFASLGAWAAPKWTASTWSSIYISGNLLSVRYLSNWTGNDLELCDGCTSRFEYSGNRTVAWEF